VKPVEGFTRIAEAISKRDDLKVFTHISASVKYDSLKYNPS
jgi:hypothetical protein